MIKISIPLFMIYYPCHQVLLFPIFISKNLWIFGIELKGFSPVGDYVPGKKFPQIPFNGLGSIIRNSPPNGAMMRNSPPNNFPISSSPQNGSPLRNSPSNGSPLSNNSPRSSVNLSGTEDDKKERIRLAVIKEMVNTEKDYAVDLSVLIKVTFFQILFA